MFRIILTFLCFTASSIFAEFQGNVEVRSGAFFHSSSRFREIYGNVSASYGLESSVKLCHCLDGWANFDWFSKRGKSDGFNDPTRIRIANVSLGVKFPYQLCSNFTPYLGIGPSFSRVWLKNSSRCCRQRTSKMAYGVVFKSGVNYLVCDGVLVDVFIDYLCQCASFKKHVDVGGLKTGIGLGLQF